WGATRRTVQRQDLLRLGTGKGATRADRRRAGARRATLSIPGRSHQRGLGGVQRRRRSVLGTGRAVEHGRLAFHASATGAAARRSAAALWRPRRSGEPGRRIVQASSERAGGDRRARVQEGSWPLTYRSRLSASRSPKASSFAG